MTIRSRVNEATFIELVLFDDLRRELLAFLRDPRTVNWHATASLIDVVAKKCDASPEQMGRAIELLERERSDEADHVIAELLFHANVPDSTLRRLVSAGKFVTVLGHRAGPRWLLEILAEQHRYPEAITTLAIHYLGIDDAKVKPFRDFLGRYADVWMLEYNIRRAKLDDAKRRVVLEVFGPDLR